MQSAIVDSHWIYNILKARPKMSIFEPKQNDLTGFWAGNLPQKIRRLSVNWMIRLDYVQTSVSKQWIKAEYNSIAVNYSENQSSRVSRCFSLLCIIWSSDGSYDKAYFSGFQSGNNCILEFTSKFLIDCSICVLKILHPIQISLVVLATCIPRCKNNGTCISYNNCSCPTGFSGPTCEVRSY